MLDDVATLMGSHGSRSHRTAIINRFAEVYSLCCRIVMVGKLTFYALHLDIINAIVMHHLHSNLRTRHI